MNNIMIKRLVMPICLLFMSILPLSAENHIFLPDNPITLDSLRVVLSGYTRYKLYFIKEKNQEEIKVTADYKSKNFLERLSYELSQQGYSLTLMGNDIYVLKGEALVTQLPAGYFEKTVLQGTGSLNSLSNQDIVASSMNKLYKIGDPNLMKQPGKASIKGYIRNSESGEPIVGISVSVDDPRTSVTTDAYGFYRILLPRGGNIVKLSGYGYEDSRLNLELYSDGNLDINMREKVYSLKGVTFSAENVQHLRGTQMGLEKVRIDRIKHVPAVFGESDVMKIVLTLPGVKSVGEASGGFNVRGGATDQNLILFNEGTIYNPTHLFGLFSAFNSDIVKDIELYKSTIPARYGGRISSVLEINNREGNNKKITGSAGIGLLTSKLHLEGPIVKDRTTFILGARSTYSDWILGLLPEDSGYKNGTASFYDISGGISHKIDSKNTLYLYGYYSRDGFNFSIDTSFRYQNINASVKWRGILNENHNLTISTGYDQYNYSTFDKANSANAYKMDFGIRQVYVRANFNWLVSEKHTLQYGLNSIYYLVNPGRMRPYGDSSIVTYNKVDTERATESSLYVSDNWNVTDKLSLDLGVRYTFYGTLGPDTYYHYAPGVPRGETTILDTVRVNRGAIEKSYHGPEFRVSARYMFNENFSFKAGYNSMFQGIHMLSNSTAISPTDIWKLSDANVKPQRGWQSAFGLYGNVFNKRLEISLEGYYKEMKNYLDYRSGAILTMNKNIERDVIETQGRAYGLELMLKKPMGKLNGWISYTYSKTELRDKNSAKDEAVNKGAWYPAAYDKPHDVKFIGNYKFTQRYSMSMNVDYSTGRPVTVPVSKYYYSGGYRLFYSDRNAYRIPDYFRVDLAFNIEPSHNLKLLLHSTITLGVYNLLGRQNAYSVYYNTSGNKIQGYQLSIFGTQIPYINLNIKF